MVGTVSALTELNDAPMGGGRIGFTLNSYSLWDCRLIPQRKIGKVAKQIFPERGK